MIKGSKSGLLGLLGLLALLGTPRAFAALPTSQCIVSALAGGTANALTIPTLPCIPTTALLVLTPSLTNTSSTVTLKYPGGPASPVLAFNGTPVPTGLLIPGSRYLLTFNGSDWFLLNSLSGTATNTVTGPTSPTPNAGDVVVWSGVGLGVLDGGGPPTFEVTTNAALKALSTAAASSVTRIGFYTQGDVPPVHYSASASACSLNGGAGDNGSQVQSSDSKCWIASMPSPAPVSEWGTSGSALTKSATGSGTALTLSPDAGDFQNNQTISVVGGGAASTVAAPTAITVTTEGTTGSTTWCTKLVSIDGDHGYSPASAEVCDSGNGNATNNIATGTAAATDQLVAWTPASGATSVAVYFGASGAETCQGVEAVNGVASTNTLRYYGQNTNWFATCPSWLPNTPPGASGADLYRGTIVSGGGTTSLVVSPGLTTAVSNATIAHDDTSEVTAALAVSPDPFFTQGTYNVTQPISTDLQGQIVDGCGPGCSLIAGSGSFTVWTMSNNGGTQLYYSGLNDIGFLSSDMASGFTLAISGPNGPNLSNIGFWRPYDEMEVNNVDLMLGEFVNDFANPLTGAPTKRRGDVGFYFVASVPGSVPVVNFNYFNSASSFQPLSLYYSGCVASFRSVHIGLQQAPAPQVQFDNAPNCMVNGKSTGPQFPIIGTLGVNGAWPPQPANNAPGVKIVAGQDIELLQPYIQYTGPNGSGNAITCLSGTNGLTLVGGQVFGGGNDNLEDNCFGVVINGTHIYSAVNANIECDSSAINLAVNGDSANLVSGTPVQATKYGVLLNGGCQNVSVSGNWQGALANVDDQASPATIVAIDKIPPGSPPTTILNAAGNQTLTVSGFQNLWIPTGCAVLSQSGFTSSVTDTTDTASAIVGSLTDPQVGLRGCIIVENHINQTITMAGGTGVTAVGQLVVPANGASNQVSYRRFVWTVDAVGGSPAMHIKGCSVVAGSATC